MGTSLSSLQEQYVQELHFLLKRNGHTTTCTEVEVPEEGTLDLKEWSEIGSCFQGHPVVTAQVSSTCCKVRTCLQGLAPPRNILFNQEIENNLKQLPQILPPLPLTPVPSAPPLESHSAQPTEPQPGNTSWKTQDELKALSPSSAVHQATENQISKCPSMDTIGAASETGSVISASPVVQETEAQAHADAAAVSDSCELPYQGVRELQLSIKDKGTEALPELSSAQRLAPSDWRGLLPPAVCLQEWQDLASEQSEINAGGNPFVSVIQPMFMGEAAVQVHLMDAALADVAIKTWKQTLQSAKKTACLSPSLVSLDAAATSVSPRGQLRSRRKWDPGLPPERLEKIVGDLQDSFDVMGWCTKQACHVSCENSEGEEEENLWRVAPTHQQEACFELQVRVYVSKANLAATALVFPCANFVCPSLYVVPGLITRMAHIQVWVKNPTQPAGLQWLLLRKIAPPPGQ